MSTLKISLRHSDLLQVPCSMIFMKHIEGTMSAPETALNAATNGQLQLLYADNELEDHQILDTELPQGRIRAYLMNFHKQDLPFSYRSVDRYARTILRVAATEKLEAVDTLISVATAIHGPGAGLDASESMETVVMAFSNELGNRLNLGSLDEVILVEKDKEVFERLQKRLKYLAVKGVVTFDGSTCFINPSNAQSSAAAEKQRVEQLSLRHLFVAMPYAKKFDNAYYFGIKQPIEHRGRKCERVDQDAFTGDIVDRIKKRIQGSELVIADITGNNPNVFFEIGYAEGLGKKVILISQAGDIPFDLKTRRQIRYDHKDILALATELSKQLETILASESET